MHEIVITGSSSGIGAAVARSHQRQGRTVLGVAHDRGEVVADLSTPAGRAQAVEQVLARSGGVIDALVCSAGLPPTGDPAQIVSVNHFGAVALIDGLFEALRAGHQPAAVVIASAGAVHVPEPQDHPLAQAMAAGDEAAARAEAARVDHPLVAYCLSKYAVACAVRERAMRWAAAGVRLNAVAPGPIVTPLLSAMQSDTRLPEQSRNFLPPLGRNGQPEEVADLVDFLLSQKSSFIHGTVLFIDGGIDALARTHRF